MAAGALAAATVGLPLWSAGGAAPTAPPEAAKAAKTPMKTVVKKRRYAIAAMGDSLTDPRSQGGKYLELLAKRCPQSRFDSYGVGGNMVNQMHKRFARDILGELDGGKKIPKPAYSHVLLLGGINDICSDETALRTNDKIKADLSAMYTLARARGMQVIALTLPPWAGFTRYYNPRREASTLDMNRWIKRQHLDGNVDALLDVYPLLSCGQPTFLCESYGWPDRVHWSKKGHEVVGKALHAQLLSDCL